MVLSKILHKRPLPITHTQICLSLLTFGVTFVFDSARYKYGFSLKDFYHDKMHAG